MEDIYTLTEAEETYGEALEILAKYHKAINKKPISWASFLVLHEIRYEVFYCEGNYLDWSEGRVSYLQELVSKEDLESFMYTQIDNYDEEEGIVFQHLDVHDPNSPYGLIQDILTPSQSNAGINKRKILFK